MEEVVEGCWVGFGEYELVVVVVMVEASLMDRCCGGMLVKLVLVAVP